MSEDRLRYSVKIKTGKLKHENNHALKIMEKKEKWRKIRVYLKCARIP